MSGSVQASHGDHALVLDHEELALGDVALKLVRMGLLVHYARWTDEALMLVRQEKGAIRLVVVPPEIEPAEAGSVLRAAREQAPEAKIPLVIVGSQPNDGCRTALREAGASWAVWEPFDESDLRYALNTATALPSELAPRKEPRGPVSVICWMVVQGARSFGVLSSLSAKGAFIEIEQPLPIGSEVQLEFTLQASTVHTAAKVIYRNARDDRRSALLPVGAGLLFDGMEPPVEDRIREFVKTRADRFTV
ncbi:MAG: PilZ domain-containing protein [Myxococcota bacterium]|nr:PilZ domain-containing protein [Myxococcota bacterium]